MQTPFPKSAPAQGPALSKIPTRAPCPCACGRWVDVLGDAPSVLCPTLQVHVQGSLLPSTGTLWKTPHESGAAMGMRAVPTSGSKLTSIPGSGAGRWWSSKWLLVVSDFNGCLLFIIWDGTFTCVIFSLSQKEESYPKIFRYKHQNTSDLQMELLKPKGML